MGTSVLAIDVKCPVRVEVCSGAEGAQAADSLVALERPARAGLLHAVLDEVARCALDHAGRDRQASSERIVVREVVPHTFEVPT